jgi:uncharacterized protein (TIGR01777 family)
LNILITGGTGFIGSHLRQYFISCGFNVFALGKDLIFKDIPSPDVVVNLAGQSLAGKRWSQTTKNEIYQSRIESTRKLIEYIKGLETKPKVLLSGSAIGVYGDGFSRSLCVDWEAEALKARDFGVRVCLLRIGIVLGKDGGALKQMLPPFRLGLGGRLGSGHQYMSWVHIDDFLGIIGFLIDHDIHGAVNITAPYPVSNTAFTSSLAKALNRPAFLNLPAFFVKALFGQMGKEILLKGESIVPKEMIDAGYVFKFSQIDQAINNILRGKL